MIIAILAAGCSESSPGAGDVSTTEDARHPGEEIYGQFCFSCHAAGIANAPKFGDAESWKPRIAKGPALLLQSTVEGMTPGMPPKGLCLDCSDQELADAIDYMVVNSQSLPVHPKLGRFDQADQDNLQ